MLRTPATRALSSSTLRSAAQLSSPAPYSLARALRPAAGAGGSHAAGRRQSSHAVSNPTLANIEKRWEAMPPQEQAELWMALRDRMTVDWKELTMQEKKASYWIAFGPHGPRTLADPNENWHILRIVALCLVASSAVFATTRFFAGKPPKTMSKEWQEMSNEYMKNQKTEAITGVSSEGYAGPGMVQSKPSGKKPEELNPE